MLRCPNCIQPLLREPHSYTCPNGHHFDLAKAGYVNLLITHSTRSHGDDVRMVAARQAFLSQGHYQPLMIEILKTITSFEVSSLVDLGCGEGAYTNTIAQTGIQVIGIDLSKTALKRAAKGSKATYVLANLTQTPLMDQSVDAALSIFSPFDLHEIQRIIRSTFIVVRPLPEHLHELKAELYPTVRPNPMPSVTLDGMRHVHRSSVIFSMSLDHDSLVALLEMTPYIHTSPQAGIERIRTLRTLRVTAAFAVDVFMHCTPTANPL